MAKKGTWDFECPQFVDFTSGLSDSSSKDDTFFDCDDMQCPTQDEVFNGLLAPGPDTKKSPSENVLMSKMTAALSAIENTPKLAMIRKHLMETNTLTKPQWRFGMKSYNHERMQPCVQIPRSKSVIKLNEIANKPIKEIGLRRSSSLNDLKVAKKQTYPMTPMCLKRTIIRSQSKVIKSTEEIELEEIARLQKQMKQHLRYNEMSLKKLNLKPRQGLNQKSNQPKLLPAKEVSGKNINSIPVRLTCAVKDKRRNLNELSQDALAKEALQVNDVISKYKSRLTENLSNVNRCQSQLKQTTESKGKEVSKMPQKPVLHKKIGFHSGVLFHSAKKINVFNFCTKPRDIKAQNGSNVTGVTSSVQNMKLDFGKENIPVNKVQPLFVRNMKGVQNQKVDSCKIHETIKKMADKRMAARTRGLSENIVRN